MSAPWATIWRFELVSTCAWIVCTPAGSNSLVDTRRIGYSDDVEYGRLGDSGLIVSKIGLGTNNSAVESTWARFTGPTRRHQSSRHSRRSTTSSLQGKVRYVGECNLPGGTLLTSSSGRCGGPDGRKCGLVVLDCPRRSTRLRGAYSCCKA